MVAADAGEKKECPHVLVCAPKIFGHPETVGALKKEEEDMDLKESSYSVDWSKKGDETLADGHEAKEGKILLLKRHILGLTASVTENVG